MAKKSKRRHIARPFRGPRIACINKSNFPLGVDFDKLVDVLQIFLDECFVPIWGTPARLVKSNKEIAGAWTMKFVDTADDDEGWHDIHKNGLPYGQVFVESTIKAGDKVSSSACHELAEMLVDPGTNLWSDGPRSTMWAYEVCDPVEEDEFLIDGVYMSDFVCPAYFELFRVNARKTTNYDYMNKLKKPFSLRPGGYMQVRHRGGVKERWGSAAKARRFAKEDRRYHRSEFREAIARHDPALYQKVRRTGLA